MCAAGPVFPVTGYRRVVYMWDTSWIAPSRNRSLFCVQLCDRVAQEGQGLSACWTFSAADLQAGVPQRACCGNGACAVRAPGQIATCHLLAGSLRREVTRESRVIPISSHKSWLAGRCPCEALWGGVWTFHKPDFLGVAEWSATETPKGEQCFLLLNAALAAWSVQWHGSKTLAGSEVSVGRHAGWAFWLRGLY